MNWGCKVNSLCIGKPQLNDQSCLHKEYLESVLTPYPWLEGSEDPWDSTSLQTKDPTCIKSSPAKWDKSPPANKEHLTP